MPRKNIRQIENEVGSKYTVEKLIGEGGFCVVLKAKDKKTKQIVAIKRMDKSKPLYKNFKTKKQNEKLNKLMYREAEAMRMLEHNNIIKLLDFVDDGHHIYIVMEFAEGGELYSHLTKVGHFKEDYVAHIMRQLISALNFMHKRNYIHRDIKAENILFKDRKRTMILLTDFGLSKQSEGMYFTNCGTLVYSAPELLRNKQIRLGYDKTVDIWAAGVLCFLLLCGHLPFTDDYQRENKIISKIMKGKISFDYKSWSNISQKAKNLISDFLKVNSIERITLDDALNHAFLRQSSDVKSKSNNIKSSTNFTTFPMMELNLQKILAKIRWKVMIYFCITLILLTTFLKSQRSDKKKESIRKMSLNNKN